MVRSFGLFFIGSVDALSFFIRSVDALTLFPLLTFSIYRAWFYTEKYVVHKWLSNLVKGGLEFFYLKLDLLLFLIRLKLSFLIGQVWFWLAVCVFCSHQLEGHFIFFKLFWCDLVSAVKNVAQIKVLPYPCRKLSWFSESWHRAVVNTTFSGNFELVRRLCSSWSIHSVYSRYLGKDVCLNYGGENLLPISSYVSAYSYVGDSVQLWPYYCCSFINLLNDQGNLLSFCWSCCQDIYLFALLFFDFMVKH